MTPHGVQIIENIEKCERRFTRGCPSASGTIEQEIGNLLERICNALLLAGRRASAIEAIEQHMEENLLKILEMVHRLRRADRERRRRYWLYN